MSIIENFIMYAIKTISTHLLVKKYMQLKRTNQSVKPVYQSDNAFFIETVNIQDSSHINQIKNENSDWSTTLPSNGIPVSYKIDTGAQCNVILLTILKKLYPEPKLRPVNIMLSAYNNSKIPVLGKCSL